MSFDTALGSTYRVQLHGLGFAGARNLVPYLHALGVQTLYLSPLFTAAPASTHGYDVVDPSCLDPALGAPEDFEGLLHALAGCGMRALLDLVPNHMATDRSNHWWWDTLRRGQASVYAGTFDIDWSRHGGKVLVPALSQPLSEALATAAVHGEPGEKSLELELDGTRFPLASDTQAGDPLPDALAVQHFRPAFWRLGNPEGNYRRFFDIDGLIGVRVEDPEVFERTHELALKLCADERVAGVRIDHVDGLWDPAAYLSRLRDRLSERDRPAVVVVEKILSRDEPLDPRFDVDGTTGYEFGDQAGALFVDDGGSRRIASLGRELAGHDASFEDLALMAKAEALDSSFTGQLDRLATLATAALDATTPGHDLSLRDVRRALFLLTVHLDVYRTYLDGSTTTSSDARRIERASARASTGDPQADRALRLVGAAMVEAGDGSPWLDVTRRWQQLSGAVMAKGVEDTATYRYPGLLAQADVGCDPEAPATTVDQFHRFARSRAVRPAALNATSTHDSKRNEDARCRLAVLSEAERQWGVLVRRWHRRYARPTAPDVTTQLVAFQALLALWPHGRDNLPSSILRRVHDYMTKAAREAGLHTTWTEPDTRYEQDLRRFVSRVTRHETFRTEMARFVRAIGPAGATNALALLVLKATVPGVPDFYQGTELFEARLTDPDNRQPVDFDFRRDVLAALPGFGEGADHEPRVAQLLSDWANGHVKLFVTRALLHLRREQPDLFTRGSYVPLSVGGQRAGSVVAFARRRGRQWVVVAVPRLTWASAGRGRFPTGRRTWPDETILVPTGAPSSFTDIFTGATIDTSSGSIDMARALRALPVAVLRASR